MPDIHALPCRCSHPGAVTVVRRTLRTEPRVAVLEEGRCGACAGAVIRYRPVRDGIPWRPVGQHARRHGR